VTTLANIPGEWRLSAACNPLTADTYFPPAGRGEPDAKAVCGRCYVEAECLAYAIDNHERYGTWGGKTTHERRAMRAKAAEAGAA
jgi:WhiB family redox-sensing transcriptional regulator